jgi:hypothetical protein
LQIHWLDVSLDGSSVITGSGKSTKKSRRPIEPPTVTPTGAAHAFLKHHQTAKIIIVIDTHSLEEDGAFVWGGTSGSYKGCKLQQILQDCIPPELFQYLSNESGTPVHAHKSIILNLACGSTISRLVSRHHLLQG